MKALSRAPPSSMSEVSHTGTVVKAPTSLNGNVSAIIARFMVDVRMFDWSPPSIEEYLATGKVPCGLPMDGNPSINELAVGFDYREMAYHVDSQIYFNATWGRSHV